ncbi:FUSC family protein [Streptomyces siamensis]|uniref:Integral membrane bound transporter domain-containing protein n=1 Tax=Streptomyces siamensis TaxID=1274986 RepID=A0ABP9JMW1_9ACTN
MSTPPLSSATASDLSGTSSASDTPRETPKDSLAPGRVGGPRRWWDWVLAVDPGLGQIQAAWRTLVSMITALAAGYGMSHAVGLPPMLGMTVGGVLGLVGSFLIAENTPARLARAVLWMPVPFCAVLPLSAWLHPHRLLSLCLLVVALVLMMVLARFGPLGLLTGILVFVALVVGEMAAVPLSECGRLFVISVVTSVALLAARLLLCYPMPREDLLRTQRAFVVEARRIADAAATALDPDADPAVAIKRMRRALRRLNITTLIIDGRLAQPEVAADPEAAELLHQYLFDAELALQGIGETVQKMSRHQVPSALRETMVVGLTITRDTHLGRADALRPAAELIRGHAANTPRGTDQDEEVRALARRVGDLLDSLADSLASWLRLGWNTPTTRAKVPFQPSVVLENGRLPEAGPAARRVVSAQSGPGLRRAVPAWRAPLQAAAAGAIALPIADAVNPERYYWGIIGAMVAMLGTNTTHERLRKLAHRVVGTLAGAVIGIALLRLIGPGHIHWTLLVIVAGLSLGAACVQRRYTYMVTGLVVALVQLYGFVTPYDEMDRLLADRLIDNALGMLVATLCTVLIFPVSTRKISREAAHGYLSALEELIGRLTERWTDPEAPVRLRGAARAVEAALHQMKSVHQPLVRMPRGTRGRGADNLLGLLATATRHAGSLAAAADIDIDPAPRLRTEVEHITQVLTTSVRALGRQITTGEDGGTWVRISPAISELKAVLDSAVGPRADRLHKALCELAALDEVLASIAQDRGMTVTTSTAAPTVAVGTRPLHGTGLAGTPAGALRAADRAVDGTVTVQGSVRCPEHGSCEARITVVDSRGKRRAQVQTAGGRYTVTRLAPGAYTLVVSSPAHPPRAESLLVYQPGPDLHRDITLAPEESEG